MAPWIKKTPSAIIAKSITSGCIVIKYRLKYIFETLLFYSVCKRINQNILTNNRTEYVKKSYQCYL